MALTSDRLGRETDEDAVSNLNKDRDARVNLNSETSAAKSARGTSDVSLKHLSADSTKRSAYAGSKRTLSKLGAILYAGKEIASLGDEEEGRSLRYGASFARRRANRQARRKFALKRKLAAGGLACGSAKELSRYDKNEKALNALASSPENAKLMIDAKDSANADDDVRLFGNALLQRSKGALNTSYAKRKETRQLKKIAANTKRKKKFARSAQKKTVEGAKYSAAAAADTSKKLIGRAQRATRIAFGSIKAMFAAPLAGMAVVVVMLLVGIMLGLSMCSSVTESGWDLSALTNEERQVAQYMFDKGLGKAQVCGILGNIKAESQFNTSAENSSSGAYGLIQWLGGRKDGLSGFAASQGKEMSDMSVQLSYLWAELSGEEDHACEMSYASVQWGTWNDWATEFRQNNGFTSSTNSFDEFKQITSARVAAGYFYAAIERGQVFETGSRYDYAQEYFSKIKKKHGSTGDGTLGGEAVAKAKTKIGAAYVWGAEGPETFDCSGLVKWCYAQVGLDLPHHTDAQFALCDVISEDELQVGDLVFMNPGGDGNVYGHVGMYAGDGMLIHTYNTRVGVALEPLHGGACTETLVFGRLKN